MLENEESILTMKYFNGDNQPAKDHFICLLIHTNYHDHHKVVQSTLASCIHGTLHIS